MTAAATMMVCIVFLMICYLLWGNFFICPYLMKIACQSIKAIDTKEASL